MSLVIAILVIFLIALSAFAGVLVASRKGYLTVVFSVLSMVAVFATANPLIWTKIVYLGLVLLAVFSLSTISQRGKGEKDKALELPFVILGYACAIVSIVYFTIHGLYIF